MHPDDTTVLPAVWADRRAVLTALLLHSQTAPATNEVESRFGLRGLRCHGLRLPAHAQFKPGTGAAGLGRRWQALLPKPGGFEGFGLIHHALHPHDLSTPEGEQLEVRDVALDPT